jgi:hypothetical protein
MPHINFGVKNAYGEQIEADYPLLDELADIVENRPEHPKYELAVLLLRYCKQWRAEADAKADGLDRAAHYMLYCGIYLKDLWAEKGDYHIVTVKKGDGVEHLERVEKEPELLPAVPAVPAVAQALEPTLPEPEVYESYKPLSGPEKLAKAREATRGLLPSLNF